MLLFNFLGLVVFYENIVFVFLSSFFFFFGPEIVFIMSFSYPLAERL